MKLTVEQLADVLLDPELDVPKLRKCMLRDVDQRLQAAILIAIAGAESGIDLDAVGDNGDSIGAWQVNKRWWPRGRRPTDWETLGVQLELLTPVWCDAVNVMHSANRRMGVQLGPGILGTIAHLTWQYGGPQVRAWIKSDPMQFSPEEFYEWREANGRAVYDRDRPNRFARYFTQSLAAVSKKKKVPLKERGIFGTAYDYWDDVVTGKKPPPGQPSNPDQDPLLPGGGNLAGWIFLGVASMIAIFLKR